MLRLLARLAVASPDSSMLTVSCMGGGLCGEGSRADCRRGAGMKEKASTSPPHTHLAGSGGRGIDDDVLQPGEGQP